jgi:hypothetical protein
MLKTKNRTGIKRTGNFLLSAVLVLALAVPTVAFGTQSEANLENPGGGGRS